MVCNGLFMVLLMHVISEVLGNMKSFGRQQICTKQMIIVRLLANSVFINRSRLPLRCSSLNSAAHIWIHQFSCLLPNTGGKLWKQTTAITYIRQAESSTFCDGNFINYKVQLRHLVL